MIFYFFYLIRIKMFPNNYSSPNRMFIRSAAILSFIVGSVIITAGSAVTVNIFLGNPITSETIGKTMWHMLTTY